MEKTKQRNYYIDFLKLIFSIIIVFYHSWLFTGDFGAGYFNRGYFAVDFYFIVTGFLFINSLEKITKKKTKESIGKLDVQFIFNKIKGLIPSLLLIFVIGYILVYRRSALDYHTIFSDSIVTEFFFSGFLGQGMPVNLGCWYISVMLLVLFILFPLAYKYKKNFNYLIAPLIIILTLGICNYFHIITTDPLTTNYIFINGFYKGLIFINLGVIAYEICNYLKKIDFTKKQKILITIIETLMYVFLLLNMHYNIAGAYLIAILFLFSIAITFSNASYTSKIFTSQKLQKLGKFGFIMYLSNIPVRTFILAKYSGSYNDLLIRYWIMVIIISIIVYILSEIVIPKYLKHRKNK